MKMTLRIAKLELNKLFSSPLSWILLVGFTIYGATIVYPEIAKQTFQQALYNLDHWGPYLANIQWPEINPFF